MPFSVLMSVYKNDLPTNFEIALNSILNQSLKPTEIVVVLDGPVKDQILVVINKKKEEGVNIIVESIKINLGLGHALKIGLDKCNFEIIARMDSDDISKFNRFERQYDFLNQNQEISIVGTYIEEFVFEPGDLKVERVLPTENNDLVNYSRYRNPLFHPTVMFRKSDINRCGSYESVINFEDYYLWLKVIKTNLKIANLPETLLHFRLGEKFEKRRGGYSYLKTELNFYRIIFNNNLLPVYYIFFSLMIRLPFRVLPNNLRKYFFYKFKR
jgi:glycosyltransferase involved in cell wall biosynthesis